MSAIENAAPDPGGESAFPAPTTVASPPPRDIDDTTSLLSELDDEIQHDIPDAVRKSNISDVAGEEAAEVNIDDDITETTLRPQPTPSRKRRESEVDLTSPELIDVTSKKRKRRVSPPWQFPTAETTTLKTADGRRASARVNNGTPPLTSDASIRGRSSSLSVPPPPSRSRQASPPWRKFEAAGPTSMVVDGKRKSGRVNRELNERPKRVSPRSKKQQDYGVTRSGHGTKPTAAAKALQATLSGIGTAKQRQQANKRSADDPQRQPSSTDNARKIAELRAQIEALQPSRSLTSSERPKSSRHKRKRSDTSPPSDEPSSPQHKRSYSGQPELSPATLRPSPRIKLRFNAARHEVPAPHPNAIFPSPTLPPSLSIFQRIEEYELKEMQQPYTENERGPPDLAWFMQRADRQAVEEAAMRKKILQEAEPGGKLSKERLSIYQGAEPQREPPKQYGHNDHLVAHALHLRYLQHREKIQHRNLAKKVAHEALEYWKLKRGPTEEDIREEQDKLFRLIHKQVVADMKAKWDMIFSYIHQRRIQEWEAQEEVKRQARLQEKLEWSENMVARQRGEAEDEFSDEGDDDDVESSDGDEEESEEENMSESSSDAEANEEEDGGADGGEMAEAELAAYLAQRDAETPSEIEHRARGKRDKHPDGTDSLVGDVSDTEINTNRDTDGEDVSMADVFADVNSDEEAEDEDFTGPVDGSEPNDIDEHATDTEQSVRRSRRSSVTPALGGSDEQNLSSDESTDMDSTDYDSDEDMSSTGQEDNDNDGDDEDEDGQESDADGFVPKNSLLSLFKDEVKASGGLPTPTTSAEGDEGDRQAEPGAARTVVDEKLRESEVYHKDLTPEEIKDEEVVEEPARDENAANDGGDLGTPAADVEDIDSVDEEATLKHMVPSPSLLRGTLRSYQHAGLDWLASLYRNGTNGILADEMGLGKTIQTIALLAHLAEEHGIWETHLVIVPTSVILNWVTEFQRFLPGFRVLGYYGTSDERQLKRKCWVNDPHHEEKDKRGYNVVITSYNIAMQDIYSIRGVPWHYLVLDEAHNIRNFESQRWQTLIRLRTQARLLLTGTPLQNSLTELWSLLTFLTAGDDNPQHGDLEEFLSNWKEPVKEIFDRGMQTLSNEAQRVVDKLHVSLRPFLLRRLKSEVEKDLPKKTESVVVCKLSKRQRQLYQDYMGLAETRKSLTQGNAVTAGKVLLSLRRVCNHPDLFDPRPIETSFGMEKSALDHFPAREAVVRRLLGERATLPIVVTADEDKRKHATRKAKQLDANARLKEELANLEKEQPVEAEPDGTTVAGCRAIQRLRVHEKKLAQLRSSIQISRESLDKQPVYGSDLRELLTVRRERSYRVIARDVRGRVTGKPLRGWPAFGQYPLKFDTDHVSDWLLSKTSMLQRSVPTVQSYADRLKETIVQFAFCTPAVTAPVLDYIIPARDQQLIRASKSYPAEADYAQTARSRTTIVFPDSRLLVFDAGKLQRLTGLLRELQAKGSRSLIFTQMVHTLNILEQFLNLLNLPYLRLDGQTSVERRALYAAEFNRPDSKYQCMILSSRAGGVGLNLTGASSVIFYDLDWNPQMDRQCMDRAHRIGQNRDVEVFKMVSEKTVEENILRRANQKSLLDQTVIQEGHFTTEYQRPAREHRETAEDNDDDEEADVAAGIERFLGGGNERTTNQVLEQVEDAEDVQAAQQARKEDHQDDADFAVDRSSKGPSVPPTPGQAYEDDEGKDVERTSYGRIIRHVDQYMIEIMDEVLLKGVVFAPPVVRKLDKHGRDPSHRKRKR